MSERIFLSSPHMGGQERAFVEQAFDENWVAPVGPHITAFEKDFETLLGGGHCVAVSSGTAALHLCIRLAGVGPGDEVLCSDLTFIASASPITFQGAKPVFVDANEATWNMDLDLLENHLEQRRSEGRPMPKAMIVVHLYGQSADLDKACELCDRFNITLIEDAAESLGTYYKDKHTGTFSRFGIFSFNGNKIITAGSGGMLVASDPEMADKARFLATQARDDAPHYQHSEVGYNYRMSNILAGIGRGQLGVLSERVEQKRAIFSQYQKHLGDLPEIHFMPEAENTRANRWLSCVTFGDTDEQGYELREAVRLALEAENIESRPVWKPMHMQPVFANAEFIGGGDGEKLFTRGLCLPSDTKMRDADIDRICAIIRSVVEGRRK